MSNYFPESVRKKAAEDHIFVTRPRKERLERLRPSRGRVTERIASKVRKAEVEFEKTEGKRLKEKSQKLDRRYKLASKVGKAVLRVGKVRPRRAKRYSQDKYDSLFM